jgi:hypothetical protein
MGQPVSIEVRFIAGKDLRFALKAPKNRAMNEAGVVASPRRAMRLWVLVGRLDGNTCAVAVAI